MRFYISGGLFVVIDSGLNLHLVLKSFFKKVRIQRKNARKGKVGI